ncbi:AAA family ATPase [Frigoriglobus tundricola]|uniref:AAA family ATPase n=1 Tax=Frigoriglobus tundricola TaxID=2774151 RepID=UPI00148EA8FA
METWNPGPTATVAGETIDRLRAALNRALRGKTGVVEQVIACLLARGHLLLEDLPGLGKTTLAKALAAAVGGTFARVQCTPDLLPGDVTGFSVFNQKTREFEFQPGPVFADVLLADEINRTTPRTQSALLEAMAERQATVDNVCRTLAPTFFVVATQNPVEHHGTYPLPEAQLDRFAMKLSVGYPDRADEIDLLAAAIGDPAGGAARATALGAGELAGLQERVARVAVQPNVRAYLVDLGRATRAHPKVALGLSPRGLLTWQRVAQAWAFLRGRPFVTPDDVQEVAGPVLGVRLGLGANEAGAVIHHLLETVAVPV